MARNSTIPCAAGAWTPVTDGAVSALRLQNVGGYLIHVLATATNTAPPAAPAPAVQPGNVGALQLNPGQAISTGTPLADLFPGITSGAGYVWVWCANASAVSVSHA